jgi:hypothetical protein
MMADRNSQMDQDIYWEEEGDFEEDFLSEDEEKLLDGQKAGYIESLLLDDTMEVCYIIQHSNESPFPPHLHSNC